MHRYALAYAITQWFRKMFSNGKFQWLSRVKKHIWSVWTNELPAAGVEKSFSTTSNFNIYHKLYLINIAWININVLHFVLTILTVFNFQQMKPSNSPKYLMNLHFHFDMSGTPQTTIHIVNWKPHKHILSGFIVIL